MDWYYSDSHDIKNFVIIVAPPKRFYRNTGILKSDGQFEIILDQRKLKTPKGAVFKVDNEALALAIATEWDAQKEVVQRSNMHLVNRKSVIYYQNNISNLGFVLMFSCA